MVLVHSITNTSSLFACLIAFKRGQLARQLYNLALCVPTAGKWCRCQKNTKCECNDCDRNLREQPALNVLNWLMHCFWFGYDMAAILDVYGFDLNSIVLYNIRTPALRRQRSRVRIAAGAPKHQNHLRVVFVF